MTHNRVAQAEQDAEAARSKLEYTLDELRGRLRPGRMLDEALDYAKDGSAGEFVKKFGRQVRGNPLPVALVGAGLAWLMMARRDSRIEPNDFEKRYRAAGEGYSPTDVGTDTRVSSLKDKASQSAARVGEAAEAAYDKAGSLYNDATGSASAAADQLGRSANDVAGRVSDLGGKTADSVARLIKEQPLVLGALGLALGAVLGSAMPGTRTENRLAGEASDNLKKQAANELDQQVDKAMNVAERAYEGAMEGGKRAATEEGWVADDKDAGRPAVDEVR